MRDAPQTIWLPLEHAEDAANQPADGLIEYIRTDLHAVALIEAERRGMMRAAEISDNYANKLANEAALWAIDRMPNAENIALAQHNAGYRISAFIRQAAGDLK